MKTIIFIATLLLTGCASYQVDNPFTLNVVPPLTPEAIRQKSAECLMKNLTPEPYPPSKPQVVFCKTKTVLPPGYVSPVPYVRVI